MNRENWYESHNQENSTNHGSKGQVLDGKTEIQASAIKQDSSTFGNVLVTMNKKNGGVKCQFKCVNLYKSI